MTSLRKMCPLLGGAVMSWGALGVVACGKTDDGSGLTNPQICDKVVELCASQGGPDHEQCLSVLAPTESERTCAALASTCDALEACDLAGGGDGGTSLIPEGGAPPAMTEFPSKVDLLLMIDNSISMSDKQQVLQEAVPRFLEGLAEGPDADVHVGIISSSLGSYGASTCAPRGVTSSDEQLNDGGRLIGGRPRGISALGLTTPEGPDGFLSWSPGGSVDRFGGDVQTLVSVVGEQGCGYEAPLEAWYRFLVDPEPPQDIVAVPCAAGTTAMCAEAQGTDSALLAQRASFLRPDSAVVVVMLTDENDCSIQGRGQLYYAAAPIDLPRGTTVCETNPNDPCCHTCATPADQIPDGCSLDPVCRDAQNRVVNLANDADEMNLRCWEQKRRFGIDFLYPTGRYVRALSEPFICTARADLDPSQCDAPARNPLFSDLTGADGPVRPPSAVFLAGIVGVPWQDIAASADDDGVAYPSNELHFQSAAQMVAQGTWRVILGEPGGDPEGGPPVPPLDPLMIESVAPRSGVTPSTSESLAGPDSTWNANTINGHEWNIVGANDLQYACVFGLPASKDCTDPPAGFGCDCEGTNLDSTRNPLCQDPNTNVYGNVQYRAKAYPGLRPLQVMRDFGAGSIVASICPRQLTDASAQTYGYGPAMDAILDRLARAATE